MRYQFVDDLGKEAPDDQSCKIMIDSIEAMLAKFDEGELVPINGGVTKDQMRKLMALVWVHGWKIRNTRVEVPDA